MTDRWTAFFSLPNLYLAFRKAKSEAFYERTHSHAVAFTQYERQLHKNLLALQSRLLKDGASWYLDNKFLGGYTYLPKSVDCSSWDNDKDGHFRALDPLDDWQLRFEKAKKRAHAGLRLVIRPTVDFQIVSVLWILHVGHLFDAVLDRSASYANRLRRSYGAPSDPRSPAPALNLATPSLFSPYFSAYREWREKGLSCMEDALRQGENILAITMDIEKFYHRVSPKFLLRSSFLRSINLELDAEERRFTKHLLSAIETWYSRTPDYKDRSDGAIPVGLSASKIIANVLLVHFDNALLAEESTLYYGRYVDDIFLVLRSEDGDVSASDVTKKLCKKLSPMLKKSSSIESPHSMRLHLPYARDSELVFSGEKQKIFSLSSLHGLDLIHQIRDQIRQQSSEYRLLSDVPDTGMEMASKTLLASPSSSLQVDALRKADVVSVRRLGFSLLLSDIEVYATDLRSDSWGSLREEFYGLVFRHILTPTGFFDFVGFIPRIFGLMLSCGDFQKAQELIDKLSSIADLIKLTTNLGESESDHKFTLCLRNYGEALLQEGLKSGTVRRNPINLPYLRVIKSIKKLAPTLSVPPTRPALHALAFQMLISDWARRPYKDYWILDQSEDLSGPPIPRSLSIQRQLRLGGIRKFRQNETQLNMPYWPALTFPTRPISFDELALVAPRALKNSDAFRGMIRLLRGAGVSALGSIGFQDDDDDAAVRRFVAPGRRKSNIRIAVTSIETRDDQFLSAVHGKNDRSLDRYVGFNNLINKILKEKARPDYLVFPELSVPLRWALRFAKKLAGSGVSFIAGVEYHKDKVNGKLRNDCLVSLTTKWPGYSAHLVSLQSKLDPSHDERVLIKSALKKDGMFYKPKKDESRPIVYGHCGFYFSVLICSDLTNISHRNSLRGMVDSLFALEWNKDTKTFSSLVESTANDLHAFVVQANNRKYGDSRIRSPAKEDFERDVVQVKGGVSDYYVIGSIDVEQLRKEQRRAGKKKAQKFKPLPIGYKMSPRRKRTTLSPFSSRR